MNFSNEEKRDIIECYILCHKNAVQASQHYFERHFDRRQPSLPTFKRYDMYDNLGEYGSFRNPNNPAKGISQEVEINVLARVMQTPSISTREIETEAGTSQRTGIKFRKAQTSD